MKVWLDDIRPPPEHFVHVQTAREAIALLSSGVVHEISLDHDLGEEETGYTVALWMERHAFLGDLAPVCWSIHSANPVGRQKMTLALLNAEKFWVTHDK